MAMEDLVSNLYARSVKPGADGKIIDTVDMTFRHGINTPPLFDINMDGARIVVTAREPGGEVVLGLRIEGELARQIREQIEQAFTKRMLGTIGNFMAETKRQGAIVAGHDLDVGEIKLGAYRGNTAKWWADLLKKIVRHIPPGQLRYGESAFLTDPDSKAIEPNPFALTKDEGEALDGLLYDIGRE